MADRRILLIGSVAALALLGAGGAWLAARQSGDPLAECHAILGDELNRVARFELPLTGDDPDSEQAPALPRNGAVRACVDVELAGDRPPDGRFSRLGRAQLGDRRIGGVLRRAVQVMDGRPGSASAELLDEAPAQRFAGEVDRGQWLRRRFLRRPYHRDHVDRWRPGLYFAFRREQ